MLLRDFSGGLKTRVHPTLIQPTESQVYQNCDNEAGILRPIKLPSSEVIPTKKYFEYFNAGRVIVDSDDETYFVEYRETMYYVSSTEFKKMNKVGLVSNVGIEQPTLAPSVSDNGVGNLKGIYKYLYTYYNEDDGSESRPSPLSTELDITDKSVAVSGIIPSADAQVTHIRLYRLGGTLTKYNLVEELAPTANSFIDNKTDSEIAGEHILDTFNTNSPLQGMEYLTVANAMLFAGLNDKLYFSEVGKPSSWSRTNYLDFEDRITGIGAVQHGLLVFTKYATYIVTGNSPDTFSKYLLSDEQGCVNHDTIDYTKNNLIWLSTDGVCMSNGGDIKIVSQARLGKMDVLSLNARVYDRAYYLAWEDGTYVFDLRYSNLCVRTLDTSGRLVIAEDRLYYRQYELDATGLQEMLVGNPSLMYYRSPVFTEGRFSELKEFKDFYLSYKGQIQIKVYLYTAKGIVKILDKHLPIERTQFDAKSLGGRQGYGMSLSIIGTGEVHEIDFRAIGRENGK